MGEVADVLRKRVSSLGLTGDMALPEPQERAYPTPPYYSGPGDERLEKRRPLPPDKNTHDPDDIQSYRYYRHDIPERT